MKQAQHDVTVRRREGFTPRIASLSDDMVVVQSMVAAGIGLNLTHRGHPGR